MEKRTTILPLFIFFLVLSLGVFLLSQHQLLLGQGFLGNALFPVESLIYKTSRWPFTIGTNPEIKRLEAENMQLKTQLVKLEKLKNDDKALRDQFQTSSIPTHNLLPAQVIGLPSFVPGITKAEEMLVDKGANDGLQKGQPVVYKDSLIGIVGNVSQHAAKITLITNKSFSLTAQTSATNAPGVVKGIGNGQMVLDNVVLSDTLHTGDTVLTKGDTGEKNIPEGLIVGKIIAVEKNPAAIFQGANMQSLVNIEKLSEVFILIN